MPRNIWRLLVQAFNDWQEDRAPRLGAALAFYTAFSLAPLLVIAISIAGAVFGEDAARGQMSQELRGMLGPEGASAIEEMVKNAARDPSRGRFAAILGVTMLVFGAAGVFGQLKDALNTIWDVEPKPGHGILMLMWGYFLSFSMVACIAFLLLVSLLFTAIVGAASEKLSELIDIPQSVFVIIDWTIALALTTLLFAILFKALPDARIAWSEVWIGAFTTAVLFTAGKMVLAFYFGRMATASTYGAAGSLVTVQLWVYYSSQILLFGAELTQVYARELGHGIEPAPYARRLNRRTAFCEGKESHA